MKRLAVTFILPVADTSGGVRVVNTYANRLAARGHRVHVVSGCQTYGWRARFRHWRRGRGFGRCLPAEASHIEGVPHTILKKPEGVTDADVPDADVVVATWWATAGPVHALSAKKGTKFYLIQHDERELCDAGDAVAATWRLPLRKVVIAEWLRPVLQAEGAEDSIDVVPNTVDTGLFFAPPRGRQPTPTVGLMLTGQRSKGCDLAIEAIRLARQSVPELKVLAFGRDEVYPGLPLPDGLEFTRLPSLDDIRRIYASCDAWLFPSRSEGFGLPILEAMACRTPVIGTPAGAAPDLIPDNAAQGGRGCGGGLLVPAEAPQAMADAIVRVVRLGEAPWRDMSDRALRTVTRYTWEHATDKLESLMRRAVSAETNRVGPSGPGV